MSKASHHHFILKPDEVPICSKRLNMHNLWCFDRFLAGTNIILHACSPEKHQNLENYNFSLSWMSPSLNRASLLGLSGKLCHVASLRQRPLAKCSLFFLIYLFPPLEVLECACVCLLLKHGYGQTLPLLPWLHRQRSLWSVWQETHLLFMEQPVRTEELFSISVIVTYILESYQKKEIKLPYKSCGCLSEWFILTHKCRTKEYL